MISEFQDYEIIEMNENEKLERWKDIYLRRPDPQIIWKSKVSKLWNSPHAIYKRSNSGGGHWEILKKIDDNWIVNYKNLKFKIKLMNFKHTGLFPEQCENWDYVINKLQNKKDKKVLNLFAYTGAITVASLSAGASVVHVDSSKGMVSWAKENVKLNNLEDGKVKYIVEDVVKFIKREIRRGNKYDAVVMDPPSFGKGKKGEIWKFEKDFFNLLELVKDLLKEDSMFVIINTYTTGISKVVIENCVNETINKKYKGKVFSKELILTDKNNRYLSCGNCTIWENNLLK